jgi:hypothetical protein
VVESEVLTYPRTVSRSFLWKVTPDRGTIVIISCLQHVSVMFVMVPEIY